VRTRGYACARACALAKLHDSYGSRPHAEAMVGFAHGSHLYVSNLVGKHGNGGAGRSEEDESGAARLQVADSGNGFFVEALEDRADQVIPTQSCRVLRHAGCTIPTIATPHMLIVPSGKSLRRSNAVTSLCMLTASNKAA